ncbi:hypothetical protein EZ428_20940 [Pedobacter frigiditerrae]|uniref:Uncharacterized protein n=1 Tax=Pedobacter frigiditerrae TaxID=2530452 RepID=A0A4R0MN44_9SPHI|nr:hypothetical protein [Pedobacter frigiditerrae]TCC88191.1 hypothetical protein EZ428_20940 [Pedobacter frigiditerrae]
MKIKILIYAVVTVSGLTTLSFIKKQRLISEGNPAKFVREVLTGKHLFVVSLQPNKNKKSASLLAESRNSFMVVSYENDSSKVIIDWTMCPDGKCPEPKLYYPEKPDYDQLDSLINTQLKLKEADKKAN